MKPAGRIEDPQLADIHFGLLIGHVMDHHLEQGIEHAAGNDVAELAVQYRHIPPQFPQDLDVLFGGLYLNLHHGVDEMLIGGALRTAEQELDGLRMLVHVVHHPVHTGGGLHPHVAGLFRLRQLGKGGLCLHEPAHDGGGVGLHNGGKQRLLAGEVAVKGPGGDAGVFHDLPQGGPPKALLQKLMNRRLLNLVPRWKIFLIHMKLHITVLYNTVILQDFPQVVKSNFRRG